MGSGPLALTLIAVHLLGVESVEDLEEVRDDEFLMGLFDDDVPAPRTLLDYLNDFEDVHIDGLNQFLNIMSRTLHQMVISQHPEVLGKDRIVDIDSTYHKHYGDLIEGVTWNYKNEWSLESQVAFNSLGFYHQLWVRPGNTKSGTDADVMINNIYFIGTLERQEINLQEQYASEPEAKKSIGQTIIDYNAHWPNQGNGGFAPNLVHHAGRAVLTQNRMAARQRTQEMRIKHWKQEQAPSTDLLT